MQTYVITQADCFDVARMNEDIMRAIRMDGSEQVPVSRAYMGQAHQFHFVLEEPLGEWGWRMLKDEYPTLRKL